MVRPLNFDGVVIFSDFDFRTVVREAVTVGIAKRIGAAAVLLLEKLFFPRNLAHTLRSVIFAPVMSPVGDSRKQGRRLHARAVHLFKILPA